MLRVVHKNLVLNLFSLENLAAWFMFVCMPALICDSYCTWALGIIVGGGGGWEAGVAFLRLKFLAVLVLPLSSSFFLEHLSPPRLDIFCDFQLHRRFALDVIGKNGCLVEGVLHLPGNPPASDWGQKNSIKFGRDWWRQIATIPEGNLISPVRMVECDSEILVLGYNDDWTHRQIVVFMLADL
jgi:hypothetical protein